MIIDIGGLPNSKLHEDVDDDDDSIDSRFEKIDISGQKTDKTSAEEWRRSVNEDFEGVRKDYKDIAEAYAEWAPRLYEWWYNQAVDFHSIEHPDVPLEALFNAEPNGSDDDSAEDEPSARWHEVPSFIRCWVRNSYLGGATFQDIELTMDVCLEVKGHELFQSRHWDLAPPACDIWANDWDDLAKAYETMGSKKMREWEEACPTLKHWRVAPTYTRKTTRRHKHRRNTTPTTDVTTNDTVTDDSSHLRGCCRAAFDYTTSHMAHTAPHNASTISLPAPQGVPATAGMLSGNLFTNNLSLGGKVNENQTAVTVTGDGAESRAVAEATAAAAMVELGTGTINSNSSSSDSSSHGGSVSSQHSQPTPSNTHHIHTATQDSTLTGGHETRRHGNSDDNDDDEQLSAAIALSLTPLTPAVPATTCPRGGGAEPCHWGPSCRQCRRLPRVRRPPQDTWTLEDEEGQEEGLSILANDGRVFSRPFVRAQRRLNPRAPPWEPLVALARAGEGDEGGLDLAAVQGPTMTPPIPITARPHLARGPTGTLPRQLTRDPAGSISESAGAT